jgi:hypothetical protein
MMAHGGLCEKPTDPKGKAELDSKLAQMQAERTKQDQMWTTTTTNTATAKYGKIYAASDETLMKSNADTPSG